MPSRYCSPDKPSALRRFHTLNTSSSVVTPVAASEAGSEGFTASSTPALSEGHRVRFKIKCRSRSRWIEAGARGRRRIAYSQSTLLSRRTDRRRIHVVSALRTANCERSRRGLLVVNLKTGGTVRANNDHDVGETSWLFDQTQH